MNKKVLVEAKMNMKMPSVETSFPYPASEFWFVISDISLCATQNDPGAWDVA